MQLRSSWIQRPRCEANHSSPSDANDTLYLHSPYAFRAYIETFYFTLVHLEIYIILTINTNYFPEYSLKTGVCDMNRVRSLWGWNWSFIFNLAEEAFKLLTGSCNIGLLLSHTQWNYLKPKQNSHRSHLYNLYINQVNEPFKTTATLGVQLWITLHTDLSIPLVKTALQELAETHHTVLKLHPNPLIATILAPPPRRRLSRRWTLDVNPQGNVAGRHLVYRPLEPCISS
jgi:hypothetical protein